MFFVFIVPFHFFYFAKGVALDQRCIAFIISYGEVSFLWQNTTIIVPLTPSLFLVLKV